MTANVWPDVCPVWKYSCQRSGGEGAASAQGLLQELVKVQKHFSGPEGKSKTPSQRDSFFLVYSRRSLVCGVL